MFFLPSTPRRRSAFYITWREGSLLVPQASLQQQQDGGGRNSGWLPRSFLAEEEISTKSEHFYSVLVLRNWGSTFKSPKMWCKLSDEVNRMAVVVVVLVLVRPIWKLEFHFNISKWFHYWPQIKLQCLCLGEWWDVRVCVDDIWRRERERVA